MKKVTLLFFILLIAISASGAYAYSEGMLDEVLGIEDEEEDNTPVSSTGNAPIARITPSNPKIQINETIQFSGSDSTDSDGDDLSFVWSFEGDSKEYEGATIERNYPDKGEYLVTLIVTDATGLADEIETTVLVVEDYHDEQSGNVNGNDDTENIDLPVDNGFISLRIEYSLESASINPLEESQVTLRLTDADGVVVQEENGVGEGDGAWSYTSDDLSSNGAYVFTIENESGSMDFDVIIDVKY
tara:strand:- start:1811 stop:2542 length:732 start_codon:yes stop_codon:yes gene_type:complete